VFHLTRNAYRVRIVWN